MACPKHGHPPRLSFHPYQCHMFRDLDARSGRTGKEQFLHQVFLGGLCIWVAEPPLGSVVAVLQLCRWIMDVSSDRNGVFVREC